MTDIKKKKVKRVRLEAPAPAPKTGEEEFAEFVAQQEAREQIAAEDTPTNVTPRGRPSTYQPRFAHIAKQFCSKCGGTDSELAELFQISVTQVQKWYTMHPEFGAAVREGKYEIFDVRVERSLAMRALGFWMDVEEVKITKDGDQIRYTYKKYFPPDVTACIFWLKNRRHKEWNDVWRIEHSGKLELENMSAEQVLAEVRKELSGLSMKEVTDLGIQPQQLESLGVVPMPKPNGSTKH